MDDLLKKKARAVARMTLFHRAGAPPAPLFAPAQIARPETQAARLKICAECRFNAQGLCRQCCGGVPVATLARLAASRCRLRYW